MWPPHENFASFAADCRLKWYKLYKKRITRNISIKAKQTYFRFFKNSTTEATNNGVFIIMV